MNYTPRGFGYACLIVAAVMLFAVLLGALYGDRW